MPIIDVWHDRATAAEAALQKALDERDAARRAVTVADAINGALMATNNRLTQQIETLTQQIEMLREARGQ